MADTKSIKTKLKSVESIGKITRAMEMIARSKMKKAIDRALGVRPYAFFALEFLVNFSYHTVATSPYFKTTEGDRTLIVEIAAGRGLCGGYNGNIFREVQKFVASEDIASSTDYVALGKYAVHHADILSGGALRSYTHFSEDVTLAEAEELAEEVKRLYTTGTYTRVLIAFTNFVSTLSQKPVIRQILPLSPEVFKNQVAEAGDAEDWVDVPAMHLKRDWSQYVVEPSEDEILNTIIPEMVTVQIFQAILDSLASEQAARMMAMKNATENAVSLSDELLLSFNHARQEGITRELSEIAAGANALGA